MKIMNSPYEGKFKVTQTFSSKHDGLDLVGLDHKEVRSTITGVVEYAGWENIKDKKQGFGLYIKIRKNNSNDRYYFGHLQSLNVSTGQNVKITDIIGVEGSSGNANGSHVHYCVRKNGSKNLIRNIPQISGIPNKIGTYDDGYRSYNSTNKNTKTTKTYLNMRSSASYGNNIVKVLKPSTKVVFIAIVNGWAKIDYNGTVGYVGPKYLI